MSNDKLYAIRHSLSHLLAMAMLELIPEAKLTIGPPIDNGFYYDFDLPRSLTPDDLKILEGKMKKLAEEALKFERSEKSVEEAKEFYQKQNNQYKVELIEDLAKAGEKTVSFYRTGDFVDLCAGPHLESTKEIPANVFKLDKVAGAYWRGDEKNKMLQRVYGLAFESKADLEKYLHNRQEAEKRDHRKLGAQLDLFSFHEEGPGFPFMHAKGMILWNTLMEWWRNEHQKSGYQEIRTPIILSKDLWLKSGHWDHYRENMYFTKIDERDFAIKPMNCPGGILVYKTHQHSYREFPIRMAEIGLVHRHELAGTLHGMMRVRAFHQDDAHIYCLPEQIETEVIEVMDLVDRMYKTLNLTYHLELSTRPTKKDTIGSDEAWARAENALQGALEKKNADYKLNPGDGAFYGPKIDFHITDAIGRTWQTATIQLDFAMPETLDLEYVSEDGSKQRPVMLHRTVFGGIERFLGVLIEDNAGLFPLWLAPVQVKILTISEKQKDYAAKVFDQLIKAGIRVELDQSDESLGKKIRKAELEKAPMILILGDKEVESQTVSIRARKDYQKEIKEESLKTEKLIELIATLRDQKI